MVKFLLLGERSIQHSLAVRLKKEGSQVHVFPGQDFKGYKIVDNPTLNDYDCVVVGSTRYFNHLPTHSASARKERLHSISSGLLSKITTS